MNWCCIYLGWVPKALATVTGVKYFRGWAIKILRYYGVTNPTTMTSLTSSLTSLLWHDVTNLVTMLGNGNKLLVFGVIELLWSSYAVLGRTEAASETNSNLCVGSIFRISGVSGNIPVYEYANDEELFTLLCPQTLLIWRCMYVLKEKKEKKKKRRRRSAGGVFYTLNLTTWGWFSNLTSRTVRERKLPGRGSR